MFRTVSVGICWKVISGCVNVSLKRSIHSNLSRILFSAVDKDLPIPTQPTALDKLYSHDTDLLLEQLRKAKVMDRILDLISMHVEVMNDKHISTCFNLIHDRLKEADYIDGPNKLTDNEAFQALCNRAMRRARYFEPDEVISVFKTLSTLGVRSNTYVMQAMLKMLCSQLNELRLSELTFLNFLLSKQRTNALVTSLQLALPLVLQVQIDQQLDSENLNEVVSSLKMACKARLKPATIQKVIVSLQSKVQLFSPDQASTVIFALFSLDTPVDGYMHLLKAAFDIVSNNIDAMEKKQLLNMIRACRKHGFYYRSFVIRLSNKAVSEQWGFAEYHELIGHFHRLHFFCPELLEALCNGICANAEAVRDDPKYSILTLSEYFTFADYKVFNVRDAVEILQSAKEKISFLQFSYPHLFFKLITSWAMLSYVHEQYLNIILNEDFLFPAWSHSKKCGRSLEFEQYVYALQWALENVNRTDFQVPSNFMKILNKANEQKPPKQLDYPLTKFLENGLGGSQFLYSGVFTRNGHFIDHVLAMRSGNYPVSLGNVQKNFDGSQQVYYIEDLQLPEDAKIITIILAMKEQYCTDPPILKALPALKAKNLSKMSYSPIVINYENWIQLPDRERIPYLMREIRQVIQTDIPKMNMPLQ